MEKGCSVDHCTAPHKARGLCATHYQQAKLAGEFGGETCSEPGCTGLQLARGRCQKHYYRWIRSTELYPEVPRCSVDDCNRPARVKSMCEAHRKRVLKGPRSNVDGPIGGATRLNMRNKGKKCGVAGCDKPAKTLGLCSTHYHRQHAGKELIPTPCSISGCRRPRSAYSDAGLCGGHDHAARRYGSATDQGLRIGALDRKGYRVIRIAGREHKEHRYIMEQLLGRPLLRVETVHHCNTVKDDNRIDGPLDHEFRSGNLQLWSKSHPSGGRVSDKVAWAVEFLELYAPELLAAKPVQLRLVV